MIALIRRWFRRPPFIRVPLGAHVEIICEGPVELLAGFAEVAGTMTITTRIQQISKKN